MWWITLALAATQLMPSPGPARANASPQATATVRIVKFATVKIGESAVDRQDLDIRATDTRFRDRDGRSQPARIVELP